jgi:hypothetical protein
MNRRAEPRKGDQNDRRRLIGFVGAKVRSASKVSNEEIRPFEGLVD